MDGRKKCEENREKLVEGLVDEDQRDEDGEYFLREARDVSDQETAFHSHDDDHYHYEPHPHPGTTHNVLNALGLTELTWNEEWKIVVNEGKSNFPKTYFKGINGHTKKKASSNTSSGPEKPMMSTGCAAIRQKMMPWTLVEIISSDTPISFCVLSAMVRDKENYS